MSIVKKISELTPKGSNLANTDLLIVGVDNGTDYDLKSITGSQILGNVVSQTITDGVTTKAPSENVVFDALANKVDTVTGSRLITSAEGTILSNTSGTNSGDETVTTIKTKLGITTLSGSNTGDETDTTIKSKLAITTLSGSNTGDQDLSNLAPKSNPTFTGLTTLDTLKVTTGNYITPIDVVGIDVTGNVNRVSAVNGRTALGLGSLATQSGTFSGTSSGTNTGDQIISDATLTTSDITTNNFSTTKHGFVPKGTNTGKYLKDDGTWSDLILLTAQTSSTAIRFDKRYVHCNSGVGGVLTGLTGNVTVSTSLTAYIGTTSFLIHNDASIPSFSSEFIKSQDSLDYKINVDNYIICTLINQNPLKVSYRIVRDVNDARLITNTEATILGNTSGTNTGDQTFLNARVQSVTSSATVTPVSTNDLVTITAQAVGLTLANPTGTFTEGQALMIRIKDNGTARTIAFDTNYRAIGVTLPTTTVISKTMYLGIIYNSNDAKWDVIGYNIQA